MSALNWGLIQDGGVLESLMHAILYAEDSQTILFGRPGKDAGQDARTADGHTIYQSKYRDGMDMDVAVDLALEELEKIKKYRASTHANYEHWKDATKWVLFANLSINPNDDGKWKSKAIPEFAKVGLAAEYWTKEKIEGKLAEQTQVREVFFGQENRVLVGLKEAHDLLKNERLGSDSLDSPMLGRDADLARLKVFVNSPEKRVLPVIGPGGIGKSRFLYESLVTLSQDGWRVLWGLPGAMAKSPEWFRLLNGTQKTCVALDDPDDPALLRAVIEQLSTVERRNWRVIISYRTDRSDVLRPYKTNNRVEEPIRLVPLSEPDSTVLINTRLGFKADEARLHGAFRLNQGNPGWTSLFVELAKQGMLTELPPRADDIATLYVSSCLKAMDEAIRPQAHTLLRWLALWGSLIIEPGGEERYELAFLEQKGIPRATLHDILKKLVDSGLVRNWGIGKRFYGIDSLLIRQHILSEWLLREEEPGVYSASLAGTDLVSKLLSAELPCVEATLQTISQLSLSRLESQQAYSLLRPIFDAMVAAAKETSLAGQIHLAELVEKLGLADPENGLDVLTAIRENAKEDQEVKDPFWGTLSFTRSRLISTLSWTLFILAEHVDVVEESNVPVVANRFLLEFRDLYLFASHDPTEIDLGKSPQQLLSRLLCESNISGAFSKPAYDIVGEHFLEDDWWPFVGDLAKSILKPERETRAWIADWTLGLSHYHVATNSGEWQRLITLRNTLFEFLQSKQHKTLHDRIWPLLTASHHSLHFVIYHHRISDSDRDVYRQVLVEDLVKCQSLLKSPRTLSEATLARPLWEWYLESDQDESLAGPARECERLYSALSKWGIHDFFRFDREENLAPETARIAAILRASTDQSDFHDFFDEAQRYLSVARTKSRDMADDWQLGDLANKFTDRLPLILNDNTQVLSVFVRSILMQGEAANPLARSFSYALCQKSLGLLKSTGDNQALEWLTQLLGIVSVPAQLLRRLYSTAHRAWTGQLTTGEVQRIIEYRDQFKANEWYWLVGVIQGSCEDDTSTLVKNELARLKAEPSDSSNCLWSFIRASYFSCLRFIRTPTSSVVEAVFNCIIQAKTNGSILKMHELEWLRDQSHFKPTMRQFVSFIQSRIELEALPRHDRSFELLPHRFKVTEWCRYQPQIEADRPAFNDLCELVLGSSYIALHWIPKYLPEIDPNGASVADFVTNRLAPSDSSDSDILSRLAYLASQYSVDSKAWASIARPICGKANSLPRKDREYIYFCLSSKETSGWASEIRDYLIRACELAKQLLDSEPLESPLRPYREWALRRAQSDLRHEQERAEEMSNE